MPSVTGRRLLRWPVLLAATLCLLAVPALGARAASGAGTIVYTASDGIYTVAGSGGTPQRIWAAPAGQHAA